METPSSPDGDAQLVWPPADDDAGLEFDRAPAPTRELNRSSSSSRLFVESPVVSVERRRFDVLYFAIAALAIVAIVEGLVIFRTSIPGLSTAAPAAVPANTADAIGTAPGAQPPAAGGTLDPSSPAPAATGGSSVAAPTLGGRDGGASLPSAPPITRPSTVADAARGVPAARVIPADAAAPRPDAPAAATPEAAAPPAPIAPPREGILHVNALPWAEVWIDGEPAGETPLGGVRLPAGRHIIRFVHPTFGERTREVTVVADESARVGIDLRP